MLASLLISLAATGCVYMLEKPPRETWKAQAQARARALQASQTAPPVRPQDLETIPKGGLQTRPNAYAVVIGIEEYRERLPNARYATGDATQVSEHLTNVMGYAERNVVLRLNEKAARTDLEKYLGLWLPNHVEPGSSVFVYYAGHGTHHSQNRGAYLLPYDGDLAYLEATAYPVKKLYEDLERLPAREVVVVLDTCFAGAGERSVTLQEPKPTGLSAEQTSTPSGKITVLAASADHERCLAHKDKQHGLLTYFFLKGLQEGGYRNGDGSLKLRALFQDLKPEVQRVAREEHNTEQTPQLLLPNGASERSR